MNCTQFQSLLDDYIDGSLSTIQLSHIQSHLGGCEHCQHYYSQSTKLITALKDIPVPQARAGYEKRILSFLSKNQKNKPQHHSWFITGFSSAVAASFALWLVFSPLSHVSNKIENVNTVNLQVQKNKLLI